MMMIILIPIIIYQVWPHFWRYGRGLYARRHHTVQSGMPVLASEGSQGGAGTVPGKSE